MIDEVSTTDRIVTALQRAVVTGDLSIGAWLRHDALAEEFSVSRTPIREALRVLAAQGFVTIVPNRGAKVKGLSGRDIREMGEVRADLHGLAAELAAERIDDDQLRRLGHAWDKFSEVFQSAPSASEDLAELWVFANEEFHGVIVEAADNHHLTLTIADLHRRVPRNLSFNAYAGHSHLLERNVEEHAEIARAISEHDSERARMLTTAHYRRASQSTARWVEARSEDDARG